MKKVSILITVVFFSFLLLQACSGVATKYPRPTEGFEPKVTYDIPLDELWGKIVNLLTVERIGIAKNDKSSNYIESEPVFAGTETIGIDAYKTISYKYTYMFEKVGDNKTKLNVICKLESKAEMPGKKIDSHDISSENIELVTRIEKAMYEKVENTFIQKEAAK